MSYRAKQELVMRTAPRYQSADHAAKSHILNEFVHATGFHRKYAISVLSKPPAEEVKKLRRPRARRYSAEAQEALEIAWAATNRICSKRLVDYLSTIVCSLEKHGHLVLSDETRTEVLAMSAATIDRLLASARRAPGALSMTKAGALLKRQVPIRTFSEWDDVQPGFFEGDLVCHCGQSTQGTYVCTLTLTDVASGWTEPVALLRRTSEEVLRALPEVASALPFPMRGLDVDNGSEFINADIIEYCERRQITFTRGRPQKKNDGCFVEQKNGHVVRSVVGHDRYEGLDAQRQLAELYRVLRLYVNLFQPSLKLVSKAREGAKSKRTYSKAKTPLQRLVSAGCLAPEQEAFWLNLAQTLDPVALLLDIQSLQTSLAAHSCRGLGNVPTAGFVPAKVEILALRSQLAVTEIRTKQATRGDKPKRPYNRFHMVKEELFGWFQANRSITAAKMLRTLQQKHPDLYPNSYRSSLKSLLGEWRKLPPSSSPPTAGRKGRRGNFEGVQDQLRSWFEEDRGQASTTLLHRLQCTYPGQFPDRHLRSLQRLVGAWR